MGVVGRIYRKSVRIDALIFNMGAVVAVWVD